MTSKEAKNSVVVGMILIDDVGLVYKVIEKFENSVAVQELGRCANVSCEIITYDCIADEGWRVA